MQVLVVVEIDDLHKIIKNHYQNRVFTLDSEYNSGAIFAIDYRKYLHKRLR
jgi:hypothetical protein